MTPAIIAPLAEAVVALVRAGIAAARPDAEVIAAARDAIAKALAGDEAAAERMRSEWRARADALWPPAPEVADYRVAARATADVYIYPPDDEPAP